jgi:hypothetical protein
VFVDRSACLLSINRVLIRLHLYSSRKIEKISKSKHDQFLSLSSSSSATSTTSTNLTNTTHDFLYLNDQSIDACLASKLQHQAPHLYDTIKSLYYSQLQNPLDSFHIPSQQSFSMPFDRSSSYQIHANPHSLNAVVLLNSGQNVYMSCVSPSLLSTSSSTQPLTGQANSLI